MVKERTGIVRALIVLLLIALFIELSALLSVYIYRQEYPPPETEPLREVIRKTEEFYSRDWVNDRLLEEDAALRAQQAELTRERQQGLVTVMARKREALLLLVNPWNAVPKDYQPMLTELDDGHYVDSRCVGDLTDMIRDCRTAGGDAYICSAYRSYEYQQGLYYNKIARVMATGVDAASAPAIAAMSVAMPGTSEHELGLAVDIISMSYPVLNETQEYTVCQQWLMEHCWDYGFILRYPSDKSDITGIIYEPWHYRYVGHTAAAEMRELGLTLEEYREYLGLDQG